MSLPPLANVFALKSPDPHLLDRVERAGRTWAPHRTWRRPHSSWLVMVETVPPTPSAIEADTGTYFTEGSDLFDATQTRALAETATKAASSLGRYEGDFGFLHVGPSGDATFVRSCGGRVPLYTRSGHSYVAFGTRLTELVALTPDDVTLDPLICAIWGAGRAMFPEGRTFFREVRSVPRGHAVTIAADGRMRIHQYWDPRPLAVSKPTDAQRRDHIEHCRTLLLDYLGRELDPDGHNILTLSGGVDSSCLAALAAGSLGYSVSTLSLVPRDEPARSQEMAYIENLRRSYEFERTWEFPLDYEGRTDAARSTPRVAFPIVHPALCLLPRVVEEGRVNTLFGGEFADQACGSPFTFPDWLRHTSPLELAHRRREWPIGRRTAVRWVKHRMLGLGRRPFLPIPEELPDYVQPAVRHEYRQWRADRRRALAADHRPLRYLAFQCEQDEFIAMNWEAATAAGARRAWPFFTRAMLELAFDCHPWELVGPGTKKLLRTALEGQVPRLNLQRETRGPSDSPRRPHPPPPAVPDLEGIFSAERLSREVDEIGVPISWHFKMFLDSVGALRSRAPVDQPLGSR
jgi:Asparagine synthase